jgi:PPM family protein phosphatase
MTEKMMRIDWALETNTGRVRDQNEDSAIVREDASLAVLCDGMGGHLAGEIASRIGVTAYVDAVTTEASDRATLSRMVAAVRTANASIHESARADDERAGMGCTLVALDLAGPRARYVSVGDSRLYRLRGGALAQITEDHTRLRLMAQLGIALQPGEARMLRGVLTRALGTNPGIDVDYGEVGTRAGDVWLLCSDGLTDELEDNGIRDILAAAADAREAARKCVAAALEAGGRDNVTVVVARVLESEGAGGPDEEIDPPRTDEAP